MAVPTTIYPTAEREVFIVKEATPATIPSGIGVAVPLTTFKPSDKPMWLDDTSWQGNMGDLQGVYQGPLIGGLDIGGDVFGDVLGHFVYNLMGDYTCSGTSATPTTTLNGGVSAGASSITLASGTSVTANMYMQVGTGITAEIVQINSIASSPTFTLISPLRFAHLTGVAVTNTTAPYTHVFSLLNGLTGAANGSGQGPTHTITDVTGIPATAFARQYAYSCVQELTFTGNAEKLTGWTAKTINQTGVIAGSVEAVAAPSSVQPIPSWEAVTGVGGAASGGTLVKDIGEYEFTLTRAIKPYFTNQGSQLPYVIARGKQGATGKLTFAPAISEAPLLALLANTQPQLQFVVSNGLTGANLVSVQVDIGLAAYETADREDGDELFGYSVPFKCVHTAASITGAQGSSMTGASGGKGCIKITLQNAIPTY